VNLVVVPYQCPNVCLDNVECEMRFLILLTQRHATLRTPIKLALPEAVQGRRAEDDVTVHHLSPLTQAARWPLEQA
jgi:hypothetical protein